MRELILIVDLGGVDAQFIARSVRGTGVYCEIASPGEELNNREAAGLILVGSQIAPKEPLLSMDVPIMALGEAAREFALATGAQAGGACVDGQVVTVSYNDVPVFEGIEDGMRRIERAYALTLAQGWSAIARAEDAPIAFADESGRRIALQFLPERNDVDGFRILSNFVHLVCGCGSDWTMPNFLEGAVEGLRQRVGEGCVICPMTGGVDTAVCAALAYKALGDRARCVFVDTGLTGEGEAESLERAFAEQMGIPIERISAHERFLRRLQGVASAEQKRQVVAQEFGRVIHEQIGECGGREVFILQGTIYSDRLGKQLPPDIFSDYTVIEPLRTLFKYEVRQLGEKLGLPASIVKRQPFPRAGLAVRCLGEATAGRIAMLRRADAIFRKCVEEAGADKGLRQYFAVMSGIRQTGDGRSYEDAVIILRAVQGHTSLAVNAARLSYELLESTVARILRDVPGVERVFYDLSPRPPAQIEME